MAALRNSGPESLEQLTDKYCYLVPLDYRLLEEAQQSQRDCAMLPVIEYFAKSLKATQDHSK